MKNTPASIILFALQLLLIATIALAMRAIELNFEGLHWITYIAGVAFFIYLCRKLFRHFGKASWFRKILVIGVTGASAIYIVQLLAIVLSFHLSAHRFSEQTLYTRYLINYTFKQNGFYRYYCAELPPFLDYIEYGTYYHRDSAFYLKPLLEGNRTSRSPGPYILNKRKITPPPDSSWRFERIYNAQTHSLIFNYTDYCGITRCLSNPADTLLFRY